MFHSQNNKMDAKQSGFRSGHSTETALLSVTEALQIAKADSKSSVLILLDLFAAFDTVNHQILLSTLSSLDITRIPLHWFESYLTGRSFRVAWGGIQSTSLGHWGTPGIGSWTPSSTPHTLHHNHSPEHSCSPFLAGGMIFPPLSGKLDPCQSSSNN